MRVPPLEIEVLFSVIIIMQVLFRQPHYRDFTHAAKMPYGRCSGSYSPATSSEGFWEP